MAIGLDTLYKNQSLLYKYLIYVLAVGLVVYFFPKGGKFKYEFQKNKAWHIRKKLDVKLMKKGVKLLLGTHDFSTFYKKV